jgi:hypothetical protein
VWIESVFLWLVTPCSVVVGFQRFGGLLPPSSRWKWIFSIHTQKDELSYSSVRMPICNHCEVRIRSVIRCIGIFRRRWQDDINMDLRGRTGLGWLGIGSNGGLL